MQMGYIQMRMTVFCFYMMQKFTVTIIETKLSQNDH